MDVTYICTYCDKQIIVGIINFSNSVKVEMYSHSISVLFFFHQTYQWLIGLFTPFFIHTQIPQKKN